MPAPVIGTRLRSVPPKGATVDTGHPLASGLQFCFVPALGPIELAKGYVGTRTGLVQHDTTRLGAAAYAPTGTTYWRFNGVPDEGFTGKFSVLWAGAFRLTLNSYRYIAGKQNPTNSNINFNCALSLYKTPTSQSDGFELVRGGTATSASISWGGVVVGNTTIALATMPETANNGESWDAWQDGTYYAKTAVGGTAGQVTGNSYPVVVGGRVADSLISGFSTNIFATWNRRLSEAEARMIYADPFCFLKV